MVTFLEINGGSCGMCSQSAKTNCSVCVPGLSSSVVSDWPLPKCSSEGEAASGAFMGGISLALSRR